MNVLHVNQSDVGGGAAIAGHRLHQGLRRIGVNSRLAAPESLLGEATTTLWPPMSPAERVFFKLTYKLLPNQTNLWRTRDLFKMPDYRAADVVHLHNLHTGLYFNYLMLPRLAREKPVVFTLHDMWGFTGHCSYSLDCERWRQDCGRCPYPEVYPAVQWDNTAIERWLKDRTYARSKLTVIAPSRWLAGLARESILGRFPVHHLPYGIDTDVYRPSDRAAARRELALPPDKTVLMFGCAQLSETRKGMDLLVELLRALPEAARAHCVLLTLGRPFPGLAELVALPTVQAGYVEDDTRKAAIYAAADIFISTTRADNLPLVLQESLACGTPMLATDVGGVGDIVRDGVTGFLVPPDRPVELAARLAELAGGENLRREMALRCRQIAVEEYGLEAVARRHLELYESLAEQVSAAQR